jgi:hypothetical protein
MRRGDLQGLDGRPQALLAAALTGFEFVAVEIDQRELGGDEHPGSHGEDKTDPDHDPFIHSGAPLP